MSTPFLFYNPYPEFDRRFDDSFNVRLNRCGPCGPNGAVQGRSNGDVAAVLLPRMDIHEDKEANTVTATFEFPGLTKENVDISVHDGQLIISGESKINSEHEESGYAVRERKFGKFSRTVQLPRGVTDEQVKASLENGVLTVTFPKSTPETATKKVTIA
ncbi:HSP20-like chaperone [Amanita muscaria]